ncbi:metal dependent phosphohydrolase [Candidatus Gastranaerophilus sp. (ex Termes propinquus)]|nr:metal dependent phosphohydrolase [Candidatus Gastranaerophilus sp. (ex Termes propinquus)]
MFDLNANYKVMTYSLGDTKAGTKMGKLQLKNLEDDSVLNCILWEEAIARIEPKTFRSGNIVKIKNASFNEKFNNCLINAMELVEEASLGLDVDEQEVIWNKIFEYINNFKDENVKNFVASALLEHEEAFKTVPAAKLMHHNYRGGLLQHTLECLEYADGVFDKLAVKLNKDEVYAACILHDIGKTLEYIMNPETGLIEYREEFKKDWVTHSQYGFCLCMNKGFKTIAKMIAAHHGRAEWGAIVDLSEKDLEPYYYIVHHLDDLSAKFGKISINYL